MDIVVSGSNDIIRNFIWYATQRTKREIEQLIEGGVISKKVNHELTRKNLYQNIDNSWSVLFTTATLPREENRMAGYTGLRYQILR